jgi:hypothetical protein
MVTRGFVDPVRIGPDIKIADVQHIVEADA